MKKKSVKSIKKRLERFGPRRVREQDILKLKYSMNFVVLLMVYVGFVLFFVWQHVRVTEIKYKTAEIKRGYTNKELLIKELRIRRAALKNPARIERIARNKLFMVVPSRGQVVRVRGSGRVNEKMNMAGAQIGKMSVEKTNVLKKIRDWITGFFKSME